MPESHEETLPEHVNDNIQAVHELHQKSARGVHRGQRVVESLTRYLGKPRTLYVLLAGVLVWISYNQSLSVAGGRPFDSPPYFYLQGVIAVYAAFMTTIVLITQNRQTKEVERNAHLGFQVNLLAEQRTAKIIALLEELRRDLPNVRNRVDPVAEALQQAVPATAVSSALDHWMNPESGEPNGLRESESNRGEGTAAPRDHLPSTGT
jgi:uncharacterized membrane protein